MTTQSPYIVPAFKYGWIPIAVDVIQGTITPPPGVWVCNSNIRADWSNAETERIGATHHFVNPGQANVGTPFNKRGMLHKGDALYDILGGANWQSASQATCENAADALNPSGGLAAFFMNEFGEKLVERGVNYVTWLGSDQYRWLGARMTTLCANAGGRHYGDYGGHLDSNSAFFTDINSVRTAFASNANALTFCLANSGFGAQYYIGGHGATQNSVVKMYLKGEDDGNQFFCSNATDLILDQMARAHRGYSTKVAAMFWPGYDERPGYKAFTGEIYRRQTQEGGTLLRSGPANAIISAQVAIEALAMLWGFDVMNWTEPGFFGSNPAISYPPDNLGGNAGVTAQGNIGQTARDTYEPGQLPAGYPYMPKGFYDIAWAGIHLSHYIHSFHTETRFWRFIPTKVNGSSYNTVEADYMVDQYQGQKVYAVEFYSTGKRSVLIFDGNTTRQLTSGDNTGTRTISYTPTGGTEVSYTSFDLTYHTQNYTI